jgi:predicted PurR-regulated permease PerM
MSATALLGWALVLVAAVALLWALSDVVLLVFAAILLAVLLRGAAQLLVRLVGLPINLSLAVVVILALLIVAGFAWLFGPRFISEGQQLVKEIYSYVGQMQVRYAHSFWFEALRHLTSGQSGLSIVPLAPKLLTVTFGTAGGLVLLIATALYLAVSPRLYVRGAMLLVPPQRRRRAEEVLKSLGHVLRYWMLGQLIDMAVVGALSTLGLALLGIPLPLALGALAGLLTFVPYLGALVAGIPAVIVASTVGPASILWVVLLYTGCHMVEGYLVAPLVTRRTVRLPPAVTLLSMVILGELYGFLGILVATPLAAAIILLVQELYVRDVLGTSPEDTN